MDVIGLLTPFMVNNYGTKLQAYAVQQSIREMGLEAEIINCPPQGEKTTVRNAAYKCFFRLVQMKYKDRRNVAPCNEEIARLRRLRAEAINAFDGQYLRLSERLKDRAALAAYGARCDAVLCGSDQIWNPYNIGAKFYMLEWVGEKTAKIAYSPSFGVDTIPAVLRWKYIRELKTFRALSARESSGQELLRSFGFPEAEWTLDPTMVVSGERWYELADRAKPCAGGGYVFCYFLGGLPLGREAARALAAKKGLRVVSMPHLTGFAGADEQWKADDEVFEAGVPEFLRLIRDAEYVITDSFHASVFSVLFHKPFCAVRRHSQQRYSTNARLDSLLGMLGLESRMCASAAEVLEKMEAPVDYAHADERLAHEREKTKRYLRNSLKV